MEVGLIQGPALQQQTGSAAGKVTAGFASLLSQAINQLQAISDNANEKVSAMAAGEDVELHDVMLALETESLAMNFATTIRNRAVEAYQEIFRMQI